MAPQTGKQELTRIKAAMVKLEKMLDKRQETNALRVARRFVVAAQTWLKLHDKHIAREKVAK